MPGEGVGEQCDLKWGKIKMKYFKRWRLNDIAQTWSPASQCTCVLWAEVIDYNWIQQKKSGLATHSLSPIEIDFYAQSKYFFVRVKEPNCSESRPSLDPGMHKIQMFEMFLSVKKVLYKMVKITFFFHSGVDIINGLAQKLGIGCKLWRTTQPGTVIRK